MRRFSLFGALFALALFGATPAFAQAKKEAKEAALGKKEASSGPDKSLAGDLTRKKEERAQAAPALQYDQFRLGVELQVASKRRQQIEDLKKIIALDSDNPKEKPGLLFRLGELYWEESKFFFFEANRKDDDYINAMNRKDKAAQDRAKVEKEELLAQSKEYGKMAMDQYSEIVQRYKDFPRTDEVLYFLGHNLMEMGEDKKSLVAYRRLIEKYPKSKFIPDAHLAFGEYYFNSSKGKRDLVEKALDSYKKAAAFPENQVYGFALYKQGWCYFNLADYQQAMDKFKAVVLYGEIAGAKAVEGEKGKGGRAGLIREARNDFVRSYARSGGSPTDAKVEFAKLASQNDDRYLMMKQLANLYYEDGKDREAALAYNILIKERPLSPEAPGFQGKIVDCVLRAGNKKMTVEQVRRLVKVMDDVVKGGQIKDEKDKKALDEARELSERTISNLAVNWHNEGRKTRDDETFQYANEVYSDYLTLFPDGAKAYDLRFFWAELLNDNLQRYDKAAEEYTKVLMMDVSRLEKAGADKKKVKPGKYMVQAAYNAVLAYDEVVKKAESSGKLKTEAITDPTKKINIPAEKKALLDACERYVKYVPQGDKIVEITYKAGKIYYDHNHLDEAVSRLSAIALKHPEFKFENGDAAGEIAANLVLDSYNLLNDWAKVNEWARRFYAEEKLAKGRFREDLAKLIEQSAFKLVNQLEARKEYAKAAEAYLGFVQEFPKSDIADKALFNASIDFYNAKMLDRAIETRKRIVQQYPKSEFVPQCIFGMAEGYEATTDFDQAADYYELYANRFEQSRGGGKPERSSARRGKKAPPPAAEKPQVWEESKAQVALFNAGVFREGLGQYRQALKNRERFLEDFCEAKKEEKDCEAVRLSIADLYEKMGQYAKATKALEEYEKKYIRDPNKVLLAEGRIARIYEEKQKAKTAARKVYERIWNYYRKLPSRTQKALDITALDAVARAHFVINEDEYKKYAGIRLRWSKLQNVGEFKASVQEKARALDGIQKLYTATVGFKSADPAICALHKIGAAYDHFAKALVNAPTPRGMPEDLAFEFKAQLEAQAQPVKDKAAEAFTAAVAKSQELDIFNDCTTASLDMLRDTYRPEQFPQMPEEPAELKDKGDFRAQAIGGDLLATIQPIPVVSAERAQENRRKAQEVGKSLDSLPPDVDDGDDSEAPVSPPPRGSGQVAKPTPNKDAEPEDEPL